MQECSKELIKSDQSKTQISKIKKSKLKIKVSAEDWKTILQIIDELDKNKQDIN